MNPSPLKILNHFENIHSWATTGRATPINVHICPYDSQCNHACPMCTAGYQGFTGAVMDADVFVGLVGDLQDLGVKSVTLTGGSEPTLHPEFEKLISCEHRPEMGLITNGSVITKQLAAAILTRLVWVRVSLDAASPEQFRRSHGQDEAEFNRVLDGIANLVETKAALASANLATVGLAFLTYPSEVCIREIVPAAELAVRLGVDYLQFRPMLRQPGKQELHYPGERLDRQKEVIAAIAEAKKLATSRTRIVCSDAKYEILESGVIPRYTECAFVHFTPAVAASGNVTLCCHHMEHEDFIIGNINDRSFPSLWNSEKKRSMVNNLPLEECPLLCRGNGFNEVLEQVKKPGVHANFI